MDMSTTNIVVVPKPIAATAVGQAGRWELTGSRFSYDNLESVAPGGWKQQEYAFCDGFYGIRLSYNLLPPKINSVLLSKNGAIAETNYRQGSDIVLKVTDNGPGVIEHNDIEYVWQYNPG